MDMNTVPTQKFKRTLLASLIYVGLSHTAYALEALTDDVLSEATGEGIAFVPEDFGFLFRGENATGSLTDRSQDTGYINLIPVGPLSSTATDTNKNGSLDANDLPVGKADIFLYGLALTKADPTSLASRVAASGNNLNGISSWGTANNPWVLRVDTANNIPNFNKNQTGAAGMSNVSFLSFEAPLYENTAAARDNEAHKLKLGMWADLFVRNPNKRDGDAGQFHYGTSTGIRGTGTDDNTRANRLRLQAISNNFSLNGTQVQLFQTLGGASGDATLSPFYDNTLGIAAMVRLNSGDSNTYRATYSTAGYTTTQGNWASYEEGDYASGKFGCGNATINAERCTYRFQTRTVTESIDKSKMGWSVSNEQRGKHLRLSTRVTANEASKLETSAINNTLAPTFDNDEGLYLYNLNVNLPLGSLYQPLVIGSDGKNFNIEVARIPNKADIYKQIYTAYADALGGENAADYKGSTCNIYQCGGTLTAAGVVYQDSKSANYGTRSANAKNATHGSITIGSTEYNAATNQLFAHKGIGALGVSFGSVKDHNSSNSSLASQTYTDLQYQQRRMATRTYTFVDTYTYGLLGTEPYGNYTGVNNSKNCGYNIINNKCTITLNGEHFYWEYATGTNGATWTPGATSSQCPYNLDTCKNDDNNGDSNTAITGRWTASNWTGGVNPTWINAGSVERNIAFKNDPSKINTPSSLVNKYQFSENNLGSAVIDGLLIQHMKLTTTGL